MTSKKERAKAQRDLYRIFIQRRRKEDKRFHLGRYTTPARPRETRSSSSE